MGVTEEDALRCKAVGNCLQGRRSVLLRVQLQRSSLDNNIKWSGTDAGVAKVTSQEFKPPTRQ